MISIRLDSSRSLNFLSWALLSLPSLLAGVFVSVDFVAILALQRAPEAKTPSPGRQSLEMAQPGDRDGGTVLGDAEARSQSSGSYPQGRSDGRGHPRHRHGRRDFLRQ